MKKCNKIIIFLLVTILLVTTVSFKTSYCVFATPGEKVIYQNNDCKISFKVNSEWESGFEAQLIINNLGEKPIKSWKLEFELPYDINTIWDGKIVSKEEKRYVIQHLQYNNEIKPGNKIIIGFNCKKVSDTQILNPTNCNIDYQNGNTDNVDGSQNSNSETSSSTNSEVEYNIFSASYKITSIVDFK